MEGVTNPRELRRLTAVLWEQRHEAELLLYRLTTARLLLLADQPQHVARALDEAGEAVARLWEVERQRAATVAAFAAGAGLPAERVTLPWLADSTPPPWSAVFVDHRDRLSRLLSRIASAASTGRELASRRLAAASSAAERSDERELQVVGYRTGLALLGGVLPPSLEAFVGRPAATVVASAPRTD